jgi:tetratricopeptide (TPR) repeat protein
MKKLFSIILFILITASTHAQTYEYMVDKAMDYLEQKDYIAAEESLKAAMRKEPANPNNIMLMVNLGTIQRNLEKYDEALVSYNIAIDKFPGKHFLKQSRAALYCEMGQYENAMKDYNAILLYAPNDLEALYRRGLLHLYNKELLSAEDDFEKIVSIAPENLQGKMGIGLIMKRRADWKEAEEFYSDLIYKHKSNPDLYFNRAECYLQTDKLARANDDINKALQLGITDPLIFILRGQLRLAQYDKRTAKEDFLKAREMGVSETIVSEFLLLCK